MAKHGTSIVHTDLSKSTPQKEFLRAPQTSLHSNPRSSLSELLLPKVVLPTHTTLHHISTSKKVVA